MVLVEILEDSELVFLAISSDKFIILETFTPAAGSNSFKLQLDRDLLFEFCHSHQNLIIFFLKILGHIFHF